MVLVRPPAVLAVAAQALMLPRVMVLLLLRLLLLLLLVKVMDGVSWTAMLDGGG